MSETPDESAKIIISWLAHRVRDDWTDPEINNDTLSTIYSAASHLSKADADSVVAFLSRELPLDDDTGDLDSELFDGRMLRDMPYYDYKYDHSSSEISLNMLHYLIPFLCEESAKIVISHLAQRLIHDWSDDVVDEMLSVVCRLSEADDKLISAFLSKLPWDKTTRDLDRKLSDRRIMRDMPFYDHRHDSVISLDTLNL